jgi:hypothetical protein
MSQMHHNIVHVLTKPNWITKNAHNRVINLEDVGQKFFEPKWQKGKSLRPFRMLDKGLVNTNEQGEDH